MKVLSSVTRLTEYTSIVELSEERFKQLDAMLDGGRVAVKSAEKQINSMIDVRDWQDDELKSVDEFKPFKEGE